MVYKVYLYNLIESLLGEKWVKVNRLTRFYIKGKFFLYPIELKDALKQVGFFQSVKIIYDFIIEKIKKIINKKEPLSFEEKVISDFGRTLAEMNMLNYTEKIWGLPCSQISVDWSKQRIKGLSLFEVLKKIFIGNKKEGPKSLVEQFYYPDSGNKIVQPNFNSYPLKILNDGKNITEVLLRKEGEGEQFYKVESIISTMPIVDFVKLLEPRAPDNILAAAENLKFRSHISLFIILNKPSAFPDQWLYFPDKEVPFGRIMEPKNFSKKMSPLNKTSLLIEFFCWENDKIWNADKTELFSLSLPVLEKLGFCKKSEVIDYYIHKEKYAYPVYDLAYKVNLQKIKDYLNQFKNLQCIGRAGSFRYNNQDHALEMGILAARSIMENKRYNIEEVGAEQAYFERGNLKDNKFKS